MDRLLDIDQPYDGLTESWHYDDATHTVTVRRTQEIDPILEAVKREHNETGGHLIDGIGRHIGTIPLTVLQDHCQRRGIPWERMAYGNEYNDELKALCREHTKLSPSGGRI
jgi:hypothetical protein